MFFAFTSNCSASCATVNLIGHYSNQETSDGDDPHLVSGYRVSLYRCGDKIFGDMGAAVGSTEGVTGRLYDVQFEPDSKHMRFKAKYVTGQEFSKAIGPGGREARTDFSFAGVLTPLMLKGTVTLRDPYDRQQPGKKSHQTMKRLKDKFTPKNETEWSTYAHPIPSW